MESREIVDALIAAIGGRNVVRVLREGDPPDAERIGEPHAIFVTTEGRPVLSLYQVAGHSSSGALPGWRNVPLERIRAVVREPATFTPRDTFNAESVAYHRVVASV